MRLISLILLAVFMNWSCTSQPGSVKTGLEVLQNQHFASLKEGNVGLITNATGIDRDFRSTVDILHAAPEVTLTALFAPEHGVRGDYPAGADVGTYRDERTGLTVYSLYGRTRKPTAAMLRNVDILVFDIQDIGVRSYTYLSTLRLAMEAALEHNIRVVVLDRPNPLGGLRVEGFPAPKENDHFIAPWFVPYVHGMTLGEIARMMNEEHWIHPEKTVQLEIIALENWQRSMLFEDTGLPWVPTSPHIPFSDVPAYYAATGVLGELDVINIGIGTMLPFRLFGAPWISPYVFAERMNDYNLAGVFFRPASWRPFYGPHQGKTQHGVEIILNNTEAEHLFALQFLLMRTHDALYPNRKIFPQSQRSRNQMFDLVSGGTWAREFVTESKTLSDFKRLEEEKQSAFLRVRARYLLY